MGIIQNDMGLDATTNIDYELVDKGEFYGTYYGQYGQELPPDELYVLTNETIENCTTYNVEKKKTAKIYTETKSADRYDIFVSGATPLIEIKNPNAKTDKELLLFRDSFGSSLAPLLVENYSKITLVDIRYMSSKILGEFIDFEDIISSITKKLMALPDDTIVYTGHGKSTMIREEKPIYLELKPRLL